MEMTRKLSFKIRYYTRDGEMGVTINGVKYTYHLDAGLISKIVKTAKRAPGKALAFLKRVSYSYERR